MSKMLIVFLFVFCISVFGQEDSKEKNSVAKGSRAMVFELGGLDNLGANSYNGGIAGKYFFTNKIAVRSGIRFQSTSITNPANPTGGDAGTDGEDCETTFGLFAVAEYHFAPKGYISPYFGGGLGYYMFSSEQKYSATYAPGSNRYRQVDEVSGRYTFAFNALIGAEIFVTKEISFSAEYMFAFNYTSLGEQKTSFETVSGSPTLPLSSTWDLGSATGWNTAAAGKFILSIYF